MTACNSMRDQDLTLKVLPMLSAGHCHPKGPVTRGPPVLVMQCHPRCFCWHAEQHTPNSFATKQDSLTRLNCLLLISGNSTGLPEKPQDVFSTVRYNAAATGRFYRHAAGVCAAKQGWGHWAYLCAAIRFEWFGCLSGLRPESAWLRLGGLSAGPG